MNLKVNISALAEAERELGVLSMRMRSIAWELDAARSSLLNSGDTFRYEASLTARKVDALMREAHQVMELSNVVYELLYLYDRCENQQLMDAQIRNLSALGTPDLLRGGANTAYHSTEQVSETYDELIKPLLGVL